MGTVGKGNSEMDDRRKTKRLDLESKLRVKRLDGSGEEEISIEVIDVSKVGLGFTCEKPLQIGAVYEGNLTLWTKETIDAFIEIVRIEKSSNYYIYGAIFIGMPESTTNRIAIYDVIHSFNQD